MNIEIYNIKLKYDKNILNLNKKFLINKNKFNKLYQKTSIIINVIKQKFKFLKDKIMKFKYEK